MRCRDVRALSSAYVDGDLDERRSSAVRGHLRVCEGCRIAVDDEVKLVETVGGIEPAEAPPALWSGIADALAREEIADSRRSRIWLMWQGYRHALRSRLAGAGLIGLAAAAAALAGVTWFGWRARAGRRAPAIARADRAGQVPADARRPTPSMPPDREILAEARGEIARADARYVNAIDELRAITKQERPQWSAAVAATFDARLSVLAEKARAARSEIALGSADPRSRDQLYAVYRKEIDFLQNAAVGGLER